jgi:chromosome segregation ATPase
MSLATLLALSLLGQRADAGAAVTPDAGVTAEAPRPVTPASDAKRLDKEVQELRQRLVDAEGRLAKAEASLSKVEQLGKQLEALEAKLEEAEARRVEAEERLQRRKVQLEQAATTLTGALQALSTGNTRIDAALRFAEAVYTGAALQHLRTARQALAQGDLHAARTAISLAMLEAQAER